MCDKEGVVGGMVGMQGLLICDRKDRIGGVNVHVCNTEIVEIVGVVVVSTVGILVIHGCRMAGV